MSKNHNPAAQAPSRRRGSAAYALLALLLVWLMAGGWGWVSGLRPAAGSDGMLPLDSFSPPSLASAVLEREAQRLLVIYAERRDEAGYPQLQPAAERGPGADSGTAGPSLTDPATTSAVEAAIAPVTRLHAQVQGLNLDLDCRLLGVYFENRHYGEFLDRYLHMVLEAPGRSEVAVWSSAAREAARACGRTDELTEALRHAVRFRPEAKNRETLEGLLEQWDPARAAGVALAQP